MMVCAVRKRASGVHGRPTTAATEFGQAFEGGALGGDLEHAFEVVAKIDPR